MTLDRLDGSVRRDRQMVAHSPAVSTERISARARSSQYQARLRPVSVPSRLRFVSVTSRLRPVPSPCRPVSVPAPSRLRAVPSPCRPVSVPSRIRPSSVPSPSLTKSGMLCNTDEWAPMMNGVGVVTTSNSDDGSTGMYT